MTLPWHSPRLPSARLLGIVWLAFAAALPAARAQTPTKIFVASYGSDSNVGNSVSPKRTFQAAHDAVAAGGEIVVLDTAGYGQLTITKSVSLVVPPGVNGFVTATTDVNNIVIQAGANDVVTLRGLIIEGFGLDLSGTNGYCIEADSVGTLRVEDCTVRNFYQGIVVDPAAAAHIVVSGCSFYDLAEGIGLVPTAGTTDAIVTDCTLDNIGDAALYAGDGSSSTTVLTAVRCIVINGPLGLSGDGNGTVYADRCTFSNDSTALDTGTTLVTLGNNTFTGNGDNGTFTSTLAAQ